MKRLITTLLAALLAFGCLPAAGGQAQALEITYGPSEAYRSGLYYSRLEAVELTGNYATDLLAVAFSQEGYHEGDDFDEMHGCSAGDGNYTEYGRCLGVNAQPWCASFISWCARRAGIPSSVIRSGVNACATSLGVSYRRASEYTPKAGDIIIFDRVENGINTKEPEADYGDHVGIVYRVTGTTVYYIDGNSADLRGNDTNCVMCHGRPLGDADIKGYGVYTDEPADMSCVKRIYIRGQYSDVDETLWYGDDGQRTIRTAFEMGLVSGKSATTFFPGGELLLCEALTLAARVRSLCAADDELFQQSEGEFWYDCYVSYCIKNGIITEGRFTKEDMFRAATRREMAEVFARALPDGELPPINEVTALPDVVPGSAAEAEILKLYNAGVLGGGDEFGTFYPDSTITRAEATAIITRAAAPELRLHLELLPFDPAPDDPEPVPVPDDPEPPAEPDPEPEPTPDDPEQPADPDPDPDPDPEPDFDLDPVPDPELDSDPDPITAPDTPLLPPQPTEE